jgi:hypothetical protein
MSGKVWPAYYGGRCASCERLFVKGTLVKYDGGRVVEEVCPDQDPGELAMGPKELKLYREAMCVKCFTVHAPGQEGCE